MNLETLTVKLTTDMSSFKTGMKQATAQTTAFTSSTTNSFAKIGKQLASGLGIAVSLALITKFGKACVQAANQASNLSDYLDSDQIERWNSALNNFNAQWERFKVTVGAVLIQALTPLLEVLNVVLNALSNVAQGFLTTFRRARGEIDKTNKSMKTLKSQTGFDELNTVKTGDTQNIAEIANQISGSLKTIIAVLGSSLILKGILNGSFADKLQNINKVLRAIQKNDFFDQIPSLTKLFNEDKLGKYQVTFGMLLKEPFNQLSIMAGKILPKIGSFLLGWPGVILAVSAAIVVAYKHCEEFKDIVDSIFGYLKNMWSDVKEAWAPLFPLIGEALKKLWNALQPIITIIGVFVGTTLVTALGIVSGILIKIAEVLGKVFVWVEKIVNKVLDVLGKLNGFKFKEAWESIKGWFGVTGYASGGFPTTGSLFVANESGPEMVGSIGGQTAVANNQQITSAIATAVYNAIVRAGGMGGNTNVTVQLDGQVVGKAAVDYNNNIVRRTGRSPLLA